MAPFKNNILSSLSKKDAELLIPHLNLIHLEQRDVLYEVGEVITDLYFMENGVASVIATMAEGSSIEVGMIGFEGAVGMSALLGENISNQHVVIQMPGKAYKISVSKCKAAFEQSPSIRKTLLRFVDSFLNLSAQTAACNRLHLVEQRCARWLLMSSDRTQTNHLPLTQEYLSAMIGVRRSGVSEAASQLQRSGLINYNQGNITILDRSGLEKSSCECYRIDRDRFDQLLASEKA